MIFLHHWSMDIIHQKNNIFEARFKEFSLFSANAIEWKEILQRYETVVFLSVEPVATAWGQIQQIHRILLSSDLSPVVAHLLLPQPFVNLEVPGQSIIDRERYLALFAQLNAEGGLCLTAWFANQVFKAVQALHPEDSEEYPIQAYLEDFLHEVHSPLLVTLLKEMKRAYYEQSRLEPSDPEMYSIEKKIISGRVRICGLLATQKEALEKMIEGILLVEEMHPELVPIKQTAQLLVQFISEMATLDVSPKKSREENLELILQILSKFNGALIVLERVRD